MFGLWRMFGPLCLLIAAVFACTPCATAQWPHQHFQPQRRRRRRPGSIRSTKSRSVLRSLDRGDSVERRNKCAVIGQHGRQPRACGFFAVRFHPRADREHERVARNAASAILIPSQSGPSQGKIRYKAVRRGFPHDAIAASRRSVLAAGRFPTSRAAPRVACPTQGTLRS
jgi:hypothetical protein